MADVLTNFYPTRHVDPNEPGLVAAYTFADGELAQFGRYINRAATGAVYDLATRYGTPLVAQGGGTYAATAGGGIYSSGAAIAGLLSYVAEAELPDAGAGWHIVANGHTGGHYLCYDAGVGSFVGCSFDSAATRSLSTFSLLNRGPFHVAGTLNGTTQTAYVNGTQVDQDVVVPVAPAGNIWWCSRGVVRRGAAYSVCLSAAEVRSKYVRDFARKVLWQWTPRDCGEGPAGGILTGSASGVGGWTCPLGAATMQFVWRPDLSHPAGGRLCLTDSQVVNMNRIDFEFGSRPLFGTFVVEYTIRDPATDSPVIGFTPRRGIDPQAAASQSYWCWMRTAAGPWWRVSMGYENNTAIPIDSADAPWPGPNAGDRCIAVVSRDVDGTVQTWNYVPNPRRGWWWSAATGNHVTTLSEGCITVAPRGAYIERISWTQGACTPHELGLVVP